MANAYCNSDGILIIYYDSDAINYKQLQTAAGHMAVTVEVFQFSDLRDPDVGDFGNLTASSLCTDTSLVKLS